MAEARTESIPPTEFHCLLFPLPGRKQKGTVALLRVKMHLFQIRRRMHRLVPESACQLLWSPLASAFAFTHCSSWLQTQDTSLCTIVQDEVVLRSPSPFLLSLCLPSCTWPGQIAHAGEYPSYPISNSAISRLFRSYM